MQPSKSARTVDFPHLGKYRVLVTAGDDGDVLVTGLPEHPVNETITRLLLIELAVFAAALLLTGVAASLSVRWSLRPLHRVASTALEVSNLPLSTGTVTLPERVAIDTPQTEAGQVADAFNHMLEHVESALHERNASEDNLRHFVADASHELRTPVAVVRSHAEYAQRVGGELPEPVAEALSRIATEADRMGHLVDDLLLLARLDAGRPLEHSPVELTRLVLEAVSDARMISADHTWQLDLPEEEVAIDGDAHALTPGRHQPARQRSNPHAGRHDRDCDAEPAECRPRGHRRGRRRARYSGRHSPPDLQPIRPGRALARPAGRDRARVGDSRRHRHRARRTGRCRQ